MTDLSAHDEQHPSGTTADPAVPEPRAEDQTGTEPAESASDAYWREICAAMPPMTDEDIRAVAVILREIDQERRTREHHDKQ